MNFLAHAYLSYHQPSITIGNMIADFVKGKHWQDYDAGIQKGIRLHRLIDAFTDTHPATLEAKRIFQPGCGKYSAVFIDIAYDHFLANDATRFPDDSLATFAQEVYTSLQQHHQILPPGFQEIFRYMKEQNWLYGYRLNDGMYKTFSGIVRRSRYLDVSADVPFAAFEENYDALSASYQTFFPDLVTFVQNVPGDLTSL
ncbi:acyl carrier protein phosphodiesterase [Chitinophaga sancti]|uniref:ACP phosphodiesterase n=1 Tax=Chitinophaga sancti TaxID=1004 RepID=A0A1K1NW30_9BACT|nr:ACP phosphodiesterase [Chitinophaga sancti]WQD60229.1 ACP phosphodiesterase [Chitinophaga sancti]WQG87643.1 ACP phosphodiesterase [Chitinophaga sancti]SFW39481.1 Acyl carrier protein phosphodiesterase [Chitinophaga sancti]